MFLNFDIYMSAAGDAAFCFFLREENYGSFFCQSDRLISWQRPHQNSVCSQIFQLHLRVTDVWYGQNAGNEVRQRWSIDYTRNLSIKLFSADENK